MTTINGMRFSELRDFTRTVREEARECIDNGFPAWLALNVGIDMGIKLHPRGPSAREVLEQQSQLRPNVHRDHTGEVAVDGREGEKR